MGYRVGTALAKDYPSCVGTISAYNLATLSGSVTYSSGNCTYNSTRRADPTVVYTPACILDIESITLTAGVCSDLEQSFDSDPDITATCTYATNWTCHTVFSSAGTTSGTYTTSGSSIIEDNGDSIDFSRAPFNAQAATQHTRLA